MRFATLTFLVLSAGFASGSPTPCHDESSSVDAQFVPSGVYNDLVWYFKYASSAYVPQAWCPKPNGNVMVGAFTGPLTDTQGFIARDDKRKEIVVAFRGTTSIMDVFYDLQFQFVPFVSPGVNAPANVTLHKGFLAAWNSVADLVIGSVTQQLQDYPSYSLVTTGHSLGGSLSSVAGISLKLNFPNVPLRLYTFGQPRTGSVEYAKFVNEKVGLDNAFRGVHGLDGVCTGIPTIFGYAHHGTEYWSYLDPTTATFTKKCKTTSEVLEDKTCSVQFPFTGLNPAHMIYYNIPSTTPFCS